MALNGSNIVIRLDHSLSFDVKYKAPGFDIFQKSNENGSLTRLMIFLDCVLLKRIFLKDMKLFSQAIFCGLVRFVKSPVYVDIGFNGSACIFHFCTFDILLNCFTVHAYLLRLNSNIYHKISQIFIADIIGIFQEADRSRKIRPEWVYSFQAILRSESKFICAIFCVSLEGKGATLLILIYF